MKFFLVLCSVIMTIQVSMTSSIYGVKQEANLKEALEAVIDIYERTIPLTEGAAQNALSKMPQTSAYDKYRAELKGYMEALSEFKNKIGPCVDKKFDIIMKFEGIIEQYEEENAPAEAKQVLELLNADNKFEGVEQEMEDWNEKYGISDMDVVLKSVEPQDAMSILPIFMKSC